jgi:hypothetical protein
MMETQTQRHIMVQKQFMIGQTVGEQCALNLKTFTTKQVCTIIPCSSISRNRNIIGNRWVYAQKDDGRFQAQTGAKESSQIPGKYFKETHSPVINDTIFHTILILKIVVKQHAGQLDIETAFLYRDLKEALWMELPDGYIDCIQELQTKVKTNMISMAQGTRVQDITENSHCLELKKAIY